MRQENVAEDKVDSNGAYAIPATTTTPIIAANEQPAMILFVYPNMAGVLTQILSDLPHVCYAELEGITLPHRVNMLSLESLGRWLGVLV